MNSSLKCCHCRYLLELVWKMAWVGDYFGQGRLWFLPSLMQLLQQCLWQQMTQTRKDLRASPSHGKKSSRWDSCSSASFSTTRFLEILRYSVLQSSLIWHSLCDTCSKAFPAALLYLKAASCSHHSSENPVVYKDNEMILCLRKVLGRIVDIWVSADLNSIVYSSWEWICRMCWWWQLQAVEQKSFRSWRHT